MPSLRWLIIENDDTFSNEHYNTLVHLFALRGCNFVICNCGNFSLDAFAVDYGELKLFSDSNKMVLYISRTKSISKSYKCPTDADVNNSLKLQMSFNIKEVSVIRCPLSGLTIQWLLQGFRRISLTNCWVQEHENISTLNKYMAVLYNNCDAEEIIIRTDKEIDEKQTWLIELMILFSDEDEKHRTGKKKEDANRQWWTVKSFPKLKWINPPRHIDRMLKYEVSDTTYDELIVFSGGMFKIETIDQY